MELSVLIAEPHDILRKGLHTILENDGRVAMIFEASNAEELRKHLSNNLLDLVIVNQLLVSDMLKKSTPPRFQQWSRGSSAHLAG